MAQERHCCFRDDDVSLQYYRLQRVINGTTRSNDGEDAPQCRNSPTEVDTGIAKDEKVPLSEIIGVLNEYFGIEFTEEGRLFFNLSKVIHESIPAVLE